MSDVTIYISEVSAASMPLNRSYIKNVAGTAKLYIYMPYISYTNSSLQKLEDLVENGSLPISAYDQALTNAPLGTSGEFETTESVQLVAAIDVYNEIIKIPQLSGLVNPTDTLAQLATAILAQGYLITFDNNDMFVNNSKTSVTIRTITTSDNLLETDEIIEIDASGGPVVLTLTATNTKVIGVKRIDKTNTKASIVVSGGGTIDGQDEIILDSILTNEPDVYIQLYHSLTDSEYKILA